MWWKSESDKVGEWIFSFDKQKEFNMFSDYPERLTKTEKEIFDKEIHIGHIFSRNGANKWLYVSLYAQTVI